MTYTQSNPQADKAFELVTSGKNVFITGKAGTGKTTLLRSIIEENKGRKQIVVLAPTGVAADNAGGATMHSFLGLPLTPYLPGHKLLGLYHLDEGNREMVRLLDMIIIDEISMVRCDMLDAADDILRYYRNDNRPFGGVQIVMFGDLYQLAPVAKDEDWKDLKEHYPSTFFFCSKALQKTSYQVIALEKVYRQTEKNFINLLNNIREGSVSFDDMELLKSRYMPFFQPDVYDDTTILMTHKHKADAYNDNMSDELIAQEKTYTAKANNWYGNEMPTKWYLKLKIGSRVMFVKNDHVNASKSRYFNGMMGRVIGLRDEYVIVKPDKGPAISVDAQTWERIEYTIDKVTKVISTNIVGTFTQIPLKLAWAVTIHKSQGLTFDNVAIDAQKAFACGQVYVALSRCRTLDGIHLITNIPSQKIKADDYVKAYMDSIDSEGIAHPISAISTDIIESSPLELTIFPKKFNSMLEGRRKRFSMAISSHSLASKIFKSKNGVLEINSTFKNVKSSWGLWDMNDGNCPFIPRKYQSCHFTCETNGRAFLVEIISDIEVHQGTDSDGDDSWVFEFRIGKILKKR